MSRLAICSSILLILVAVAAAQAETPVKLRPPAVPLVPVDPYFSIWSAADTLNDAGPQGKSTIVHWTGAPNSLTSLVRIDGKPFRIMGNASAAPILEQTGLRILPTTVTYTFAGSGVQIDLSFMTPLLPDDLMVFSRPVTYLTWTAKSTNGKTHDVQVEYDNSAELVVGDVQKEKVTWSKENFGDVKAIKIGSVDQPVLGHTGDRVRINWGYEYVAVPDSQHGRLQVGAADEVRQKFGGEIAEPQSQSVIAADAPVLSATFDLGKVGDQAVSRYLMLAYDDIHSAQYFHRNLDGYWKKDGATIGDLLQTSAREYDDLQKRCQAFDREFMADLEKAGGPKYAWLGALAYRQSLAASKVVADEKGQPLYFCKENTSNGCMGTVDVFYPQAPLILLISPSLSKAMLAPVLEYGSSPRWTWPNAPHDVGTWPKANGQVYGGSKSNGGMPVEETGNMLLLVAAIAQAEGNADFAGRYWPVLTKWAEYLQSYGRDPENQLCTDDFAGHLAHNANLAGKAICALGAYGKLAGMRGDHATEKKYLDMAREFAVGWVKQADDGDHFRLAFDQPNTWSSKYNLVWDKILGLNLFPDEAIQKEMAFYRKHIDEYGLPLDGRLQRTGRRGADDRMAHWSKTDWAFWTACLTNNQADFEAITDPIYKFFNEGTQRVGLTDLYFTDKADAARMHSRPVIGGIFVKLLYDHDVWKKWNSRDKTKAAGPWAPLPQEPQAKVVVPAADIHWKYTTEQPGEKWPQPEFDDASWKTGQGGFGSSGTPGIKLHTPWQTSDIWLRGKITIPEGKYTDLQLGLFHDEDVEIYIDGKPAVNAKGFNTDYEPTALRNGATLKPGSHSIAAHCHQTTGGQGIDLEIVDLEPGK